MDIDIEVKDIDRSYQIGAKAENLFVRYSERCKVFSSKRRLKGKNFSITESLRKLQMSKLRAAIDKYGFRNVWAIDGKILYKVDDTPESKPAVYYQ